MKYPELFKDQPEITPEVLQDLESRGLIVSEKSEHRGERRRTSVTNATAGEVVGYSLLAAKLKDGEISQEDARVLLVIEATRPKGPRETHISRLVTNAFAFDKMQVQRRIMSWAKNQR